MNKELTPLEWLINYESFGIGIGAFKEEDIKNMELIIISLKALEIIKEKKVNIGWLILSFDTFDGYNWYNRYPFKRDLEEWLSKEQYRLLKGVLKDE